MGREDCKSLHAGSIPAQASTFLLGEAPSMAANSGNETDLNGAARDHYSRPSPELGSADVPAKPKRKYRAPPSEPGVYLLFLNKRLVYVGRSDNPVQRVRTHRTNGRQFDYAVMASVPAADAAWVETALIEALSPPQNRRGNAAANPSAVAQTAAPAVQSDAVDPDATMLVKHVVYNMERYALSREFKEAVATGELPTFEAPIGPRTSRTFTHVRTGDVTAWLERKLSERRGQRKQA